MRNARLDEAQAKTKIVKGNINNLRYADDTTVMAPNSSQSPSPSPSLTLTLALASAPGLTLTLP